MNTLIALTLTSSLAAAPAATPASTPAPKATLAAQVEALVKENRPSKPGVSATLAARRAEPDSLKNGAIIGGVVAGSAMGIFVYTLCKAMDDTQGGANCAGPAVTWGAIAGAGGAAVGAGVDALFERKSFKVGFRF